MKWGGIVLFIIVLGIINVSLAHAVDSSDIIAMWRMDEGNGSVLYNSSNAGSAYDGDIYGATWTDGISGKALQFDGTSAYVKIRSNVPTPVSGYTIEAWAYLDRTPDNLSGIILEKWLSGQGPAWILSVLNQLNGISLNPNFDWGVSGSGLGTPANFSVTLNEWHYIAGTVAYNPATNIATSRIYVDGTLKNTVIASHSGTPSDCNTDVAIGVGDFANLEKRHYFPGKIDEITIYNRALSDEEIQQNYYSILAYEIGLDIDPNSLNLKSNGEYITGYLCLDKNISYSQVNINTIRITMLSIENGEKITTNIPAVPGLEGYSDYDGDEIIDIMVKFDRDSLISLLLSKVTEKTKLEITVEVETISGKKLIGKDTIIAK
ncbi:MAG: LamG domain-containing protein [Candidatus Omnitrophica bacterium]|nr:LamG domain-containing protein [Candidatus Omnitrophota bacterium]